MPGRIGRDILIGRLLVLPNEQIVAVKTKSRVPAPSLEIIAHAECWPT